VALASGQSGRRLPLGDDWSAEVAFDQLRVMQPRGRGVLEACDPRRNRIGPFRRFEITWSPAAAQRIERAAWTTCVDGAEWELRPRSSGPGTHGGVSVGRLDDC
jgi:hypothetical protein